MGLNTSMIIYARELIKEDEPFSFIASDGTWPAETNILNWLTEHFGEAGYNWTYWYLIDYFEYPDADWPFMTAVAADVAWEFNNEEDALLFKLVWG